MTTIDFGAPEATTSSRIFDGLARIATVMRSDEWLRAQSSGLTPTQLAILEYLRTKSEKPLGVKEIAAHLSVSQPTTTDSINALERKGYIVKSSGTGDRRAVVIRFTALGRTVLEITRAKKTHVEQAIQRIPCEEQEQALVVIIKTIKFLQDAGAIPIQAMCATCKYFLPFQHGGSSTPHHCALMNLPFGPSNMRVDCREHELADPLARQAAWQRFEDGDLHAEHASEHGNC
jgi:DNA-binding MarR family transcriptional regulator